MSREVFFFKSSRDHSLILLSPSAFDLFAFIWYNSHIWYNSQEKDTKSFSNINSKGVENATFSTVSPQPSVNAPSLRVNRHGKIPCLDW